MLGKVIIENGVKKIQALTADTGIGAPVGSYLYLEKKSNPQGYLYCDGSTFDETAYPALYQYLGTNVLPDWRELGAKGAEKNTTLIFDSTETDPRTGQAGTQNHDVFTQGEFKDDQLQNHEHGLTLIGIDDSGSVPRGVGVYSTSNGNTSPAESVSGGAYGTLRYGDITRGKSRAVFIYIKATSGLTENQQENVLNTINENNSYSTEEHPTGAKWIDGKPIYRKIIEYTLAQSSGGSYDSAGAFSLAGIDNIITAIAFNNYDAGTKASTRVAFANGNILIEKSVTGSSCSGYAVVEYTKTTD